MSTTYQSDYATKKQHSERLHARMLDAKAHLFASSAARSDEDAEVLLEALGLDDEQVARDAARLAKAKADGRL